MNLRDKIFAANDLRTEEISIPEWGVTVCVYELTAGERERISSLSGTADPHELIAETVIMGVRDSEGVRIFSSEDKGMLLDKSYGVLDRLYSKILDLSGVGMSDSEQEDESLVEKNLTGTHNSGTTTE